MRAWLIEKLGGYATAQDAMESITPSDVVKFVGGYLTVDEALDAVRSMTLKERNAILTLAVKKIFNTIDADDILKQGSGGQWLLEGRELSKAQIELLQVEAAQLLQMSLWKVLQRDILYQANRKMYLQAENLEQVVTAKFWLYTFDTMRTRITSIAAGSALFNHKEKK